ncbi:hypothetical protein [Bradyrhizobium sp.]|uniref:hypothetical protein n=1 Tax=Bradyrhizobium sp. TaxID=376 RepID=UPI002627E519|nr:hypothetical protein [Bradyrhizobium sp.]
MITDIRAVARARALAAILAVALSPALSPTLSSTWAHADEPGDVIYNPPPGSRWIVDTEARSEEIRPEGSTTSLAKTRAELTVEAKTPDGFRLSWVQISATVEGTARSVPLRRAFAGVLQDVVIHLSTDPAGKPLRVDNLDEARAAMRRSAENLAPQFAERPAARALFDQLVSGLTEVNADHAASAYVDALGSLALAQNAGMKPGEYRWTSKPAQNPLGGDALMSNERLELSKAEPAGRLTFVDATSIDPVAMSDFMKSFAKSLLAASGDSVTPERIDLLVKSMVFSFDKRGEFEVENGMTRRLAEKSTTVFRGMEQNLTQTEARTIAVTPAR